MIARSLRVASGLRSAVLPMLALLAVAIAACGDDNGSEGASSPSFATPPPATGTTATDTATSDPQPGNAEGVPSLIEYEDAFPDLPDLDLPVAMVEIPGQDQMLVILQDGQVLSFEKDRSASEVTVVFELDVRRDGLEEGLLGFALDPEFETNGHLFLYYNAAGGELRTVLSRFETMGRSEDLQVIPGSELELLAVPQPFHNHNGGQVAFGPDGMLYLGLGDGGSGGDPYGNGQDLSRNLLGSIIRIDISASSPEEPYRIPPDNPFVGQPGVLAETWAYGLRNPWRFSFDRETGDLWAGDVGQASWEEIDLVVPGGNYGWNIMEATSCFEPRDGCDTEGLMLPVAEYGHDDGHCSVTGGFVYRGSSIPALRGTYLYADWCSGAIWGLDADRAANGEAVEPIQLQSEGQRISSFAEDLDGELYMLAFDGRIYRITGAST